MKKITLIKLGGSVITDKEKPGSLKKSILSDLTAQIARARKMKKSDLFILAHGQGSFAHVPAKKYQTAKGFINNKSRFGMAEVLDSAARLNRIVVKEFLKKKIPAVSVYMSSCLAVDDGEAAKFSLEVFEELLNKGLVPVTGGDVLVDRKRGCAIWPAERILSFLAREFQKKGAKINSVIHVTEADGLLDKKNKIVPVVVKEDWPKIAGYFKKTKGTDVTGGMKTKVLQSLELAKFGICSYIISGQTKNNLFNLLANKKFKGTVIK